MSNFKKIFAAAAMLLALSSPVFAQGAAEKAAVDAAKAAGTVGEQADGYLGFVSGSADAATTAAVKCDQCGPRQRLCADRRQVRHHPRSGRDRRPARS